MRRWSNSVTRKRRKKCSELKVGHVVSIKLGGVDKAAPFHPNMLLGNITEIENNYARVVTKSGKIHSLISPTKWSELPPIFNLITAKKSLLLCLVNRQIFKTTDLSLSKEILSNNVTLFNKWSSNYEWHGLFPLLWNKCILSIKIVSWTLLSLIYLSLCL